MTSFSDIFRQAVRSSSYKRITQKKDVCQTYHRERCTICPAIDLNYSDEVSVKEKSFQEFWDQNNLPGIPEKMIASPRGRGYRTVSKRRAFRDRSGQVLLGLTDISETGRIQPVDVKICAIEPPSHALIYNFVQQFITSRDGAALSKVLSHVIIKGNYDESWVVFNISDLPQDVSSSLTHLSKKLTKEFKNIPGLFYTIEETSKYYLSDKAQLNFRKIYGKNEVFLKVGGLSFLYSPLVFSQTNGSIIEPMLAKASELMCFQKSETVYDLYCGYGLFGLSAAKAAHSVVGIEISSWAINSANENAKRNKIGNIKFYSENVTADSLNKILPKQMKEEAVILDPPRNGTNSGVIEFLAERKMKKVLYLFCEADVIKPELKRWTQNGYSVKRVVSVDMFPATDHIETMVLLEPK
jgi:23S rRNA (uracil1939-C5)-methyltransferase